MTEYDDKGQLANSPCNEREIICLAENPHREACAWAAGRIRTALKHWHKYRDADYVEAILKGLLGALDERLSPKLDAGEKNENNDQNKTL